MPVGCRRGRGTGRQVEAVGDGQQSSGDAVDVNPIGSKVSLLSTPKAKPPRAIPIALPLSKSSVYTLASMPKPGSREKAEAT